MRRRKKKERKKNVVIYNVKYNKGQREIKDII